MGFYQGLVPWIMKYIVVSTSTVVALELSPKSYWSLVFVSSSRGWGQRDSGKLLIQLARLDLIGRQLAILVVPTQLPSMVSGRTQ